MNLERLHIFYAVAEEKSFSRAAKRLYRTQSAVSQSIRILEEEIGDTLFIRDNRSVILSPAGKILYEHVTEVMESIDMAQVRIDSLKDLKEGKLVISCSNTTACYILPEVLKKFRLAYPGVRIILKNGLSDEATQMVVDRKSDIGVVMLPVAHPKLQSKAIVTREDVVICPTDHPLCEKEHVDVKDLLDYEFLLLDSVAHTRQFINSHFARIGKTPKVAMEVGNMEIIKKMVTLGFGISIIPRIAVLKETSDNSLKALSIFKPRECRTLGVVYPSSGVLSLASKIFIEMLEAHFKTFKMI